MFDEESQRNETAFRRMEESIKSSYPHGHFVAIAGGEIVGDAGDFMALHKALKAANRDPRKVLIVQAGHVYPERATIFTIGWIAKVAVLRRRNQDPPNPRIGQRW